MSTQTDRISDLIIRHLNGEVTKADEQELEQWMQLSTANRQVVEEFLQDEQLKESLKDLFSKEEIWKRLQEQTGADKVVPMGSRSRVRWAVAASVIIATGLGILALTGVFSNKKTGTPPIAKLTDIPAPSNTKAVITLADGRTISLDSLTTVTQGNVELVKTTNGEIVYQGSSAALQYNTLVNPRGSKAVSLTLNDGTKVWLNAESSLRYPIAFSGNTRNVEITGEAYFEVMRNNAMPFKVNINGKQEVEVLGTHFNINSYGNEEDIKVTLLKGSVKVINDAGAKILKPGEQAAATARSPFTLHRPDTELVMAWKEGLFRFRGTNIKEIMNQAERWYDVDVIYQVDTKAIDLSGILSRKENISELLKVLEATNLVHFKVDGRKIIVTR